VHTAGKLLKVKVSMGQLPSIYLQPTRPQELTLEILFSSHKATYIAKLESKAK
jgi:hypothetical protein